MIIRIPQLADIAAAAKQVLAAFPQSRVFLFYGQMGAGKTTFIKALCEELGVTEGTSSPTFSIVNEYEGRQGPIFHFDFYRLKEEQEAYDMGYEEYFYSDSYCFVEWPEKIPNLLPHDAKTIQLRVDEDFQRTLEIT